MPKTTGKYILKDGEPVLCEDLMTWANWFETSLEERQISQTRIGVVNVSTFFLSIAPSSVYPENDEEPPYLFETLVCDGPTDGDIVRYTSRAAAETGHQEIVDQIRTALGL